jgi:hypothetical protein
MSKKTNWRLSEERRLKLQEEFGTPISNAQLRGHPRKGELSISLLRKRKTYTPEQKYNEIVHLVKNRRSVTAARKEIDLSVKQFRALNTKYGHLKRRGAGRYGTDAELFTFVDAKGNVQRNIPFAGENARLIRKYKIAVKKASSGSSAAIRAEGNQELKELRKVKIVDATGRRIRPATNLNKIRKAEKSMSAEQRARFSEKFYERELGL